MRKEDVILADVVFEAFYGEGSVCQALDEGVINVGVPFFGAGGF